MQTDSSLIPHVRPTALRAASGNSAAHDDLNRELEPLTRLMLPFCQLSKDSVPSPPVSPNPDFLQQRRSAESHRLRWATWPSPGPMSSPSGLWSVDPSAGVSGLRTMAGVGFQEAAEYDEIQNLPAEGVRLQLSIAKRRVEMLEARLATMENPPPLGSPPRQLPPPSLLRESLIPEP